MSSSQLHFGLGSFTENGYIRSYNFLRAWNRLLKLLAIICTLLVPNFAGLLRTSHLPIEIAKIETLKILSGQNREIKHLLGTLFLKN